MVSFRKAHLMNKKYGKVKSLWSELFSDGVLGSAMADNGSYTYVSCYDRTVVIDSQGKELNCFETDGFEQVSTTANGKYAVITTLSQVLLISPQGYKVIVKKPGISCAKLSTKGEFIAVGIDHVVECFNLRGEPLWEYDVKERIWDIKVARDSGKIAVGTSKEVFRFDFFGKMEWSYRTGNLVSELAISANGEQIAAASGKLLYLFNKRGQPRWSKEVGTVKCLSCSDDFKVLALGQSREILSFDNEGNQRFSFTAKDFINAISVSPGGECVVAGTGSEIFNKSQFHCFERQGEHLWYYDAKGNIGVVVTSQNGEYVGFGDNSKRMTVFDNMAIAGYTIQSLLKAVEGQILMLEKLGIGMDKEKGLLKQVKQREKKTPLEALEIATELEGRVSSLFSKYEQGRQRIPDWIKTLGLSMEISEEHINQILPIFAEYQDIKENDSIQQISASLKLEMALIQSVMDAVNRDKISKMRSSRAIQLLKTRMLEALGAYNSFDFEKKQLEEIHSTRAQFLINLEDQIRAIFLDIVSKRSYKRKLSQLAKECDNFNQNFNQVIGAIEQRVENIAEWMKHDSDFAEDTELYIEHDIVGQQDKLNHHILIENNYDYDLKDLEVWCFANRSELQPLEGADSLQHISRIPKNSTKKISFGYRYLNPPISGIHGYIAFSPPRELLDNFPEQAKGKSEEPDHGENGELDEEKRSRDLHELMKLESLVRQCFSPFSSPTRAILGKLGIKKDKGLGPETLTIGDDEIALSKSQVDAGNGVSASSTKYLKFSINEVPGPQFIITGLPMTQKEYSGIMENELNEFWQKAIDLPQADAEEVRNIVKTRCKQLNVVKESEVKTRKGKAFVYWFGGKTQNGRKLLLTIIVRQRKKDVEVGFSAYSDEKGNVESFPQSIITELKERFSG